MAMVVIVAMLMVLVMVAVMTIVVIMAVVMVMAVVATTVMVTVVLSTQSCGLSATSVTSYRTGSSPVLVKTWLGTLWNPGSLPSPKSHVWN